MKSLLCYAIFYCLMITVASQSTFTCDPSTDCQTATQGSLVPDPNDCERYYVCISLGGQIVPSTNSIKCNDGQYFDQVEAKCLDEPIPGTCGPNICPLNLCTSQCPMPYMNIAYVANKYDCNSYYICLQTGSVKVTCPTDTPYFDGTTCVADESKCCNFCTAYCVAAGTQIVDPCDCTSYYICLTDGLASENYKFTCASGTFYDEATATCQIGSCINICSKCGSENSTTSTQTTAQLPIETTPTTVTTSATASSTTTSSTTTASAVTTPTTPIGGCTSLESFVCPSNGNFQMCPYCFKYYYHCSGGTATISECSGNNVYNPNDQFPYCLDPANCPYP